jgi:hypothetical protein
LAALCSTSQSDHWVSAILPSSVYSRMLACTESPAQSTHKHMRLSKDEEGFLSLDVEGFLCSEGNLTVLCVFQDVGLHRVTCAKHTQAHTHTSTCV